MEEAVIQTSEKEETALLPVTGTAIIEEKNGSEANET